MLTEKQIAGLVVANAATKPKQARNEQLYYDTLKRIARGYQTVEQMRRNGGRYGLTDTEEIEFAYENMQQEAERAIKGKRRPK